MKFGSPPKPNEIEVSLFGPGYGESILLHLGNNEWVIVDSCLNKDKIPAPLEYLQSLGLNVAKVVKLVIATHWHDDHVGGLGALFRNTPSAEFVCSEAMKTNEFLQLIRSLRSRSMMTSPGVKEFNDVVDILNERTNKKQKIGSPIWATANRVIWSRQNGDNSFPAQITSLSPSDMSITLAKYEIGAMLPKQGAEKTRVTPRLPNHTAVALWIKAGNSSILLGSDLEITKEPTTGWTAILDSSCRPQEKAAIFKVAHHGSITAHEPRVWTEMLLPNRTAILAPFVRGKALLPKTMDARRICELASSSFATAYAKPKQRKNRPSEVKKTIQETVRSIREVPMSSGLVRLRKNAMASPETEWQIDLLGTATPLQNLCA